MAYRGYYRRRYSRRNRSNRSYHGVRYGRAGSKGTRWGAFKNGFKSVWSAANSALDTANKVKRLINVEFKNVQVDIADNTSIPYTLANATYALLNPVAIGDADNQRNGKSIRAKSLDLNFAIQWKSSGNAHQTVRYAIILQKDADGGLPDRDKIWQDTSIFNTFRNSEYPYECTFLYNSKSILLDEYHAVKYCKHHIPLNFKQIFRGDGSAYTDISRCSLWIYLWSDQSTDNYPYINHFQSLFKYIDN